MTTIRAQKPRIIFTIKQCLGYAKLMVDEGYTNKQVMDISVSAN